MHGDPRFQGHGGTADHGFGVPVFTHRAAKADADVALGEHIAGNAAIAADDYAMVGHNGAVDGHIIFQLNVAVAFDVTINRGAGTDFEVLRSHDFIAHLSPGRDGQQHGRGHQGVLSDVAFSGQRLFGRGVVSADGRAEQVGEFAALVQVQQTRAHGVAAQVAVRAGYKFLAARVQPADHGHVRSQIDVALA